jgi:hypothetical protein
LFGGKGSDTCRNIPISTTKILRTLTLQVLTADNLDMCASHSAQGEKGEKI